MLEIFVEDNSIVRQEEAMQKDNRHDVYVKKGEDYYKICIMGKTSLFQEINDCFEANEPYDIEPNLIIVNEVTNQCIIENIIFLNYNHFFDFIKPCQIQSNHILYPLTDKVKQVYKNVGWKISFPIDDLIKIY